MKISASSLASELLFSAASRREYRVDADKLIQAVPRQFWQSHAEPRGGDSAKTGAAAEIHDGLAGRPMARNTSTMPDTISPDLGVQT